MDVHACSGWCGRFAWSLLLMAWQAPGAELAGGPSSVTLENGRISVHAADAPLERVLTELGGVAGVRVRVDGDLSGVRVSIDFDQLDLGPALRRLLSERSHLLIDSTTPGAPQRTIRIILLEPHAPGAQSTARLTPEDLARTEERPVEDLIYLALSSQPAAIRAAAVDAATYAAGGDSAQMASVEQALVQLLSDDDEDVRSQTLQSLKDNAERLPVDAVGRIAREDPSAAVRIQALELLLERDESRALEPLRIALSDPEPSVRLRASELIEDGHLQAGRHQDSSDSAARSPGSASE